MLRRPRAGSSGNGLNAERLAERRLELTSQWAGLRLSRQGVDYEQTRRLAAMVAPAVRRGGWKPKCLPPCDPHFRRAVVELVLKLAVEHVARVRAVAPLRTSGLGAYSTSAQRTPSMTCSMSRTSGSCSAAAPSKDTTRGDGGSELIARPSLCEPRRPALASALRSASCLSGSPRAESSAGDECSSAAQRVGSPNALDQLARRRRRELRIRTSTYVKRLDEQFVAQIRAGAAVTTMFTASEVRIGDRVVHAHSTRCAGCAGIGSTGRTDAGPSARRATRLAAPVAEAEF